MGKLYQCGTLVSRLNINYIYMKKNSFVTFYSGLQDCLTDEVQLIVYQIIPGFHDPEKGDF